MAATSPGFFRRRFLVEPAPGTVTAELEDDYHRMVVSLAHRDGIVIAVSSEMKRSPWTTCPGAMAEIEATWIGQPLTQIIARERKTRNCTHLFDLGQLAAAHAGDRRPTTYEIEVADAVDGPRAARMFRDGAPLFSWILDGNEIVAPGELSGRALAGIRDWIGGLDEVDREGARLMQFSAMMSMGRTMPIPAGASAERFATGACYTLKPERAVEARRRPAADIDFSTLASGPLADRSDMFSRA